MDLSNKPWATLLFVDFSNAFDSIHKGKMEQILLVYGRPKVTVAAIMMLYKNTKVKVRSLDGDTDFFDIVLSCLQSDTLALYLFIICQDNVIQTSIYLMKKWLFTEKREEAFDTLYKLLRTQTTLMT